MTEMYCGVMASITSINKLILVFVKSCVVMERGVDSFGPKDIQSPILPLHNAILLWGIWSKKLMLDPLFTKKFFNTCNFEF